MYSFAYNERKQHGTAEFPAAYYYVNEEHPSYNMPFHWHREWELIRVQKGTFLLSVDGEEYLAKAGDILLLREGMLHGGIPQKCVYQCFNFDLHGLFANVLSVKEYLRPFYRQQYLPEIFYPDHCPEIYPIVDEIMQVFESGSPESIRTLTALSNIARLFAAILKTNCYTRNPADALEATQKTSQLKPVLEYIENHFSTQLSLAELAAVVDMNPRYFCRFFSSITQQTPMNYVNYYRIEQASNMLVSSELSVTEIGMECGFCDTSHFVKIFKKYKGITPKQFRVRYGA